MDVQLFCARFLCVISGAVVAGLTVSASGQPLYRAEEIPLPPGCVNGDYVLFSDAINDAAHVIGHFRAEDGTYKGFLYLGAGQFEVIDDTNSRTGIYPSGLNEDDEICGSITDPAVAYGAEGWIWSHGQFQGIEPPNSYSNLFPEAINELGQVPIVDQSTDKWGLYVWDSGHYETLPYWEYSYGYPELVQINDDGDVIGSDYNRSIAGHRALVWKRGRDGYVVHALPVPDGVRESYGAGFIVDNQWYLGTIATDQGLTPCYWDLVESLYVLPPAPISGSLHHADIYGLAERRQIVGSVYSSTWYPILWQDDNSYLIDDLMVNSPGWSFTDGGVLGMNRHGEMAARGLKDGVYRRAIIHPTTVVDQPEPGNAGVRNTFTARGIGPGNRAKFYGALAEGSTPVSGCSGVFLSLRNPISIGAATGKADWTAQTAATVPESLRGRTVYLQCVDTTWCIAGEVTTYTFE